MKQVSVIVTALFLFALINLFAVAGAEERWSPPEDETVISDAENPSNLDLAAMHEEAHFLSGKDEDSLSEQSPESGFPEDEQLDSKEEDPQEDSKEKPE